MKNFNEFVTEVKEAVEKEFPTAKVTVQTAHKNNDTVLTAISVLPEDAVIAPCVYLDSFYRDYIRGGSLTEILSEICDTVRENLRPTSFQNIGECFASWEWVKEKVFATVVGQMFNQENLDTMPYTPVADDLAFIYRIMVDKDATITVLNHHLNMWGKTVEELHEIAIANTEKLYPSKSMSLLEPIAKMNGMTVEEFLESDMAFGDMNKQFVISNEASLFGATAVFTSNYLKKHAEFFGNDFYILPSSIHECIVMPVSCGEADALSEMVKEVNRMEVHPKEWLSDHVYIYKKDEDVIISAA